MYEQYYRLSEKPFQLTPDERYFFDRKRKNQEFDYLEYGLRKAEGIILITGETGSGKTTLIQHLTKRLTADGVIVGWITTTCGDANEMLRFAASAFDIPCEEPALNKTVLLRRIASFLQRCGTEGKTVRLIVEDSQGLSDSALEELRMLFSHPERPKALLQIILLGPPELRRRLLQGPFEQLRQFVIALYHLPAFDVFDTREYIAHRLQMAGWQGEPTFTEGALRRIYAETCGIARQINLVCERLLLWGGLLKKRQLEAGDVHDVIRDLREKSLYVTARATNDRSVGVAGQKLAPIGAVTNRSEQSRADANSEEETDQTVVNLNDVGEPNEALSAQPENARPTDERRSLSSPESDHTRLTDHLSLREKLSRMPLAQLPGSSQEQALRPESGPDSRSNSLVFKTNMDALRSSEDKLVPEARALSQRGRVLAIRIVAGLAALAGLFFVVDSFLGGQEGPRLPQPEQADGASLEGSTDSLEAPAVTNWDAKDRVPSQEIVNRRDGPEVSQPSAPQKMIASVPTLSPDTQGTPAAVPTGPADLDSPRDEIEKQFDSIEGVQHTPAESDVTITPKESPPEVPSDITPVLNLEQSSEDAVTDGTEEAESDAAAADPTSKPDITDRGQDGASEPTVSVEGSEALARAHFTSSVQSREPVDTLASPIAAVQLSGGKLYYFTEVVGLSGRSIQHRWEYEGQVVSTVRFSIGSDRWRVYSAKTVGNNLGSWRVFVIDGRGNVLKSTPFVVE